MNSLVVFVFSALFSGAYCQITAYRWEPYQPYNLSIPKGALVVGSKDGEKYYVAQGVANGYRGYDFVYGLIPARICKYQSTIFPTIGKGIAVRDGILILCTSRPNLFSWISTSHDTIAEDLGCKRPVPGGKEASIDGSYSSILYICRYKNYIGKVPAEDPCCYYASKNGQERQIDDYSLLVYSAQ